jgi:hypothetical protein
MMHGVEAVVTEAEIRDRAGEGALPSGEYDYHQFLESYPSSFLPLLLAPNLGISSRVIPSSIYFLRLFLV